MVCSRSYRGNRFRHQVKLALVFATACFLSGCSGGDVESPTASIQGGAGTEQKGAAGVVGVEPSLSGGVVVESPAPPPPLPEVEISTTQGIIRLQLFRDQSPVTVENFLANYVSTGFYNDTIFHYVDAGFMIAGGGYTADLTAKETRGEIFNEARSDVKNLRGTIAMARHPEYANSATSQFFFNLADNPGLDHEGTEEGQQAGYCVFGKVIEGMDVLDRIAQVEVRDTETFQKLPTDPIVIQSMKRTR